MTSRAFDLALFVGVPANANDASVVSAIGPPFATAFKNVALAGVNGVVVSANVPAATSQGQAMISGPGPGFAWTAATTSSSLPAPNAQYQILISGPGPTYAWTLGFETPPPAADSSLPVVDGAAYAGASPAWSRGDHVHPTDTTRYSTTNPAGYQTSAQVSALIAASAYVLPTATTSVLGGVKVDGSTITINAGVISGAPSGLADAPSDGTGYIRQNGAWSNVFDAGTF